MLEDYFSGFDTHGWIPWVVVASVTVVILIIDLLIVHRRAREMSMLHTFVMTLVWLTLAAACGVGIFFWKGGEVAFYFLDGYLLEYVLSVDNLVVFHFIFHSFGVPTNQMYKPLSFGIVGAVLLRLGFFAMGTLLLTSLRYITLVFGGFLIATGLYSFCSTDQAPHPGDLMLVRLCRKCCRIWPAYDEEGRFFVLKPKALPMRDFDDEGMETEGMVFRSGSVRPLSRRRIDRTSPLVWHGTLLVLVVVALETVDLIFAVDSTAVKLGLIPDVFVAYTSTLAALFGIRTLFFFLEHLLNYFRFMKFGLSVLLVIIGFKVAFEVYYIIPPYAFLCVVLGVILVSVVASAAHAAYVSHTTPIPMESVHGHKAHVHGSNGTPPVVEYFTAVPSGHRLGSGGGGSRGSPMSPLPPKGPPAALLRESSLLSSPTARRDEVSTSMERLSLL